jgi:S1-C subfamily serine protease
MMIVGLLGLTACAGGRAQVSAEAGLAAVVAPETGKRDLSRRFTGTGFFINASGVLLTAAHVVTDCTAVYVSKDRQVQRATVVVRSPASDLALIQVERTMGIPAVFSGRSTVVGNDLVFVAAYGVLPELMRQGGVLSNAVVADGREASGLMSLVSSAREGTSGAPVFSALGHVVGIVTERQAEGRVLAVSSRNVKAFLADAGVSIDIDDRPQLGPMQDRAARAASVSAAVDCFKPG